MNVFSDIKLPKVLFETQSEFNGAISVVESGKTRKLLVNGTLQSANWNSPIVSKLFLGRAIEVLKEQEPDARKLLILGLGGGTMQQLAAKIFPGIEIVSVDIDEVMVQTAKDYFDLDSIPNHRIIINDACRVIVEPEVFDIKEGMFDSAIVDIFVGDKFPELGKSGNFIGSLKRLVRPGGFILFNRIYHGDHQAEVNLFIEMLHEFLVDVQSIIIAGKTNSDNVLIYGRV
jgi:spermidine synthase